MQDLTPVPAEEKVAHMREVMAPVLEKGAKLGPIAGLFSVVAGGVFDPDGGGGGDGGGGE